MVVKVHDGDSIDVIAELPFHLTIALKLRLYGINTPELATAGLEGENARDYLKARCLGANVLIKTYPYPGDKYGRWLAIVEREGVSLNQEMIDKGHAVPYFG
jgi:endonuclease YncB( thermonuclease family)